MGSFSYGSAERSSAASLHRYCFLEPYLGAGYYPMDGYEGVQVYDVPQMHGGMAVYGDISYSKPLSQEQLDAYGLYELPEDVPSKAAGEIEKPSDDIRPDVNHIQLSQVPAKFVFSTKNPGYRIVSVQTSESESGYGNIALPSSAFHEERDGDGNPTGSFTVDLGRADMWRNVSLRKNGVYEQKRMDVKDIQRLYLEQSSVHQLSGQSTERQSPNVTSVYLNYVDSQFIYPTKNPDYQIVSVPYPKSENGFAKITVSSNRIFPTLNTETRAPVPGKFSVNLGDPNGRIGCSIKENGAYHKVYLSASEIGKIHLEKRRSYMQEKRDATKSGKAVYGDFGMESEDEAVFE